MKRLPNATRQIRIREFLSRQPGVSISQLAKDLKMSEMTIRCDLAMIEGEAHIQCTHGGAVLSQRMMLEFDYRDKRAKNRAAKLAIAHEARKLVKSGHRVILKTGSS